MTKYMIMFLPVIILFFHFGLVLYSVEKLSRREVTRVYSKQGWIIIIIFLGIIGPIAYLLNEERN